MGGNDSLLIHGAGVVANGSYTPGLAAPNGYDQLPSYSGQIVAGATTINFSEYDGSSSMITVDGIANFTVNTSAATDVLWILQPNPNQVRVQGTVNGPVGVGVDMVPLTFVTGPGAQLTVNTFGGNDTVRVLGTAGLVTVNSGDGNNTFQITNTGAALLTVNTGNGTNNLQVTNTGGPVNIAAGNGPNTVQVLNTGAAVLNVALGGGNNNIQIFNTGGPVNIGTGGGNNTVRIFNTGAAALNVVTGVGNDTFTINNTGGPVNIDTGGGNDTVNVEGTGAGTVTTVTVGAGNKTLGVGAVGLTAQNVLGAVTFQGPGAATLVVDDSANPNITNPIINANSITGLAPGNITFNLPGLTALTVNGGPANNGVWNVTTTPAAPAVTNLNTGAGNNLVLVQATAGPLNINGQNGQDSVTIGSTGTVQNVLGAVNVTNAAGQTALTVDDSANPAGRPAVVIDVNSITGLAPANITYVGANLSSLSVRGGGGPAGGNTFTVVNTIAGILTTLASGPGNDTVRVQATTGDLNIFGQNGQDTVLIGSLGTVQNINGNVLVTNANGFTDLTVDDRLDAVGRVVTFDGGQIAGLAPALISYNGADLTTLTINGGTGGNNFTVVNTPPAPCATTLNSGASAVNGDTVTVRATAGPLTVNGQAGIDDVTIGFLGLVANINGNVRVTNALGFTALTVDDSADPVAVIALISDTQIVGLAPAVISYVGADLLSLDVLGGPGGNFFLVTDTPAALFGTTLHSGTGVDTVTVWGTTGDLTIDGDNGRDSVSIGFLGNVQGVAGDVTVQNALNFTTLTVDDSADPGGRVASVSNSRIVGLAPGIINYVQADLQSLTISGGTAVNTFNVLSTPSNAALAVVTTLNSGTSPAGDTINVGSAPPGAGGTIDALLGTLVVNGQAGADLLTVNDDGNAVNQNYAITAFTVLRTGIPGIVYNSCETLVLNSGAGALNAISVLSTLLGNTTIINTGPGANVVAIGGPVSGLFDVLGPLFVNGLPGAPAALVFNDQANLFNTTYTITAATVNRPGWTFVYAGVNSLVFNGGQGNDVYNVLSTALGTATTINTGLGANVVAIGGPVSGLFDVLGPLFVNGVPGAPAALIFNDQANFFNTTYTITAGAVNRPGWTFLYTGVNSLVFNGGQGNDVYNIWGTALGTVTTVNTGLGANVVAIGGPVNGLFDVLGPLFVNGIPGAPAALIFNDQVNPFNTTYTITANTVSRPGWTFTYAGVVSMVFNGGFGNNVYRVWGTALGTVTTINCGPNADVVAIGSPVNGLFAMVGPLFVNGGGGPSGLVFNDQANPFNTTYTITSTVVSRPGWAFTYAGVSSLVFNGGNANDVYNVLSTALGTTTTINAGVFNDVINLGGPIGGLSTIAGPLFVNGGAGVLVLNFNDRGNPFNTVYTVTPTTISRPGFVFTFFGVQFVNLLIGTGNDQVNVLGVAPGTVFQWF
jgi:hypothetical protein